MQYFIPKRRRVSFKIVGNDLLALLWCFYIYSLILESAIYKYNNTDKNSIKTEKLAIIQRDYKLSWGSNHKRGSYTYMSYYIYTDSKSKDLKRIVVSDKQYSELKTKDFIYINYYKGKLGSAFTTLNVP